MSSKEIYISVIIPVYNRPKEIEELLASLSKQTLQDFEVVIVEDGSGIKCESIVNSYKSRMDLKYFYQENSGPGPSRNYGYEKAKGNYCIFLDSDCILPSNYFEVVRNVLINNPVDAFGGPDRAHEGFTKFQKAINYSMTSFFTTGGIRGGSEKLGKFYPRSFNMGYSRDVYDATKGFSDMRFGEDIDMSIRILKCGFKIRLIKQAFVYHKRRTNLKQFYKQVFNSGIARINLYERHPESLKLVYFTPALFVIGAIFLLFTSFIYTPFFLLPFVFYILLLFCDSTIKNKSFSIGLLSVLTSLIQLSGYGFGFASALWERIILKR
ncbi:MAG: glycosyltransferase [Prolixibacteraceae bacterium]